MRKSLAEQAHSKHGHLTSLGLGRCLTSLDPHRWQVSPRPHHHPCVLQETVSIVQSRPGGPKTWVQPEFHPLLW